MKKILIIEDDLRNQALLKEAIADLGEVEVSSGRVFDETVSNIRLADIILLDYELKQGHDGEDFLRVCQAENKKTLGISSSVKFAPRNFMGKEYLHPQNEEYDFYKEKLRTMVKRLLLTN